MKTKQILFSMTLILLTLKTTSLFSLDWPQWRGENRNGITSESGWNTEWDATGPPLVWRTNVGIGVSSVTISNGKLYTMGNENDTDFIHCLNAETGEEIWKYTYPCQLDPNQFEGGPGSTPTVHDGKVYTISREAHVFCLDAETGDMIWRRLGTREWGAKKGQGGAYFGFTSSPLIEGDLVLINVGRLIAMDKNSGITQWQTHNIGGDYSSPVAFNLEGVGRSLAMMHPDGLIIFKADDGAEILRFPLSNQWNNNNNTPVISGSKVFITTGEAGCVLLDVTGGDAKVVWKNKKMKSGFCSPILHEGVLYGLDVNSFVGLDFETGKKLWDYKKFGKGSFIIADDKLVMMTEKSRTIIAETNPDKFKQISSYQVMGKRTWALPIISNGYMYLRNNEGDLVCLDIKNSEG